MNNYKNSLTLMRIPFSVYLMPVYWFALSALPTVQIINAFWVFLILHLFAYPASNGYNSYYDRDNSSIGGLKSPPVVNPQLMHLVLLFDLLAVGFGTWLNPMFGALVAVYLLISKAYSYDGVRLKKYPILSTIVVTVFQGAFTFLMVQVGVGYSISQVLQFPNLWFALVSTLFLCGSYPLTQIYQHQEDSRRGDHTLSLLLGIKGTFIFASVSLLIATGMLVWLYTSMHLINNIFIFLACSAPITYVFGMWVIRSLKDKREVNFENTMRMNKVSSLSISIAFILILILS